MDGLLKQQSLITFLSFGDERKQSCIYLFLFAANEGSLLFPFSVCSKQMEVPILRHLRFLFAGGKTEA
jgi:hypothetical protein